MKRASGQKKKILRYVCSVARYFDGGEIHKADIDTDPDPDKYIQIHAKAISVLTTTIFDMLRIQIRAAALPHHFCHQATARL